MLASEAVCSGKSSGDDEIDRAVWNQTQQELADAWLEDIECDPLLRRDLARVNQARYL